MWRHSAWDLLDHSGIDQLRSFWRFKKQEISIVKKSRKVILLITGSFVFGACGKSPTNYIVSRDGTAVSSSSASPTPTPGRAVGRSGWSYFWGGGGSSGGGGSHVSGSRTSVSRGGFGSHGSGGGGG
ncbi:MAG: hypothetical protein ABIP97_04820 [Chthoniobacterales bacterium]